MDPKEELQERKLIWIVIQKSPTCEGQKVFRSGLLRMAGK